MLGSSWANGCICSYNKSMGVAKMGHAIWVAGVMYACMVKNVASSGRVAFKSRYYSMYGYIMSICTNINNVWVGGYGK